MKKLIVVCGPTASGKSDLAVEIAKKIGKDGKPGGEVISVDSRQVYEGLDIGTGKITKREMQGVPHHLLDVANPKEKNPRKQFTVETFKKLADKKIAEIIGRGHVPILCGGTGFYIDAVVHGQILPSVGANPKLRVRLEKKTAEVLFAMLKKLDSKRAKNIDAKNKRRLVRAIEIASALGKVPSLKTNSPFSVLTICTRIPDEILKKRIHARLESRIKAGMIREAKRLHASGLSWKRMDQLGLEYRYLALHLQGELTKSELVDILTTKIWQYARRQKSWFRRDEKNGTKIVWMNPLSKPARVATIKKVSRFINS